MTDTRIPLRPDPSEGVLRMRGRRRWVIAAALCCLAASCGSEPEAQVTSQPPATTLAVAGPQKSEDSPHTELDSPQMTAIFPEENKQPAIDEPKKVYMSKNDAVAAISALKERSNPKSIQFVCILAAPEGIKELQRNHPDVEITVAGIDQGLNKNGYIFPGLGDAGDRIYGTI